MSVSELPTEASPLLDSRDSEAQPSHPDHKVHTARTIVLILCVVILIVTISTSLLTIPSMQLLESIICEKYYGISDVDEELCKIGPIQSDLAYLNGLVDAVAAVISIVLAFPYGILADKIGRRPIFMLSMFGMWIAYGWTLIVFRFWQSIPLYTIMLSSLFQIIGGGNVVAVAALFSLVADVEEEKNRSVAFFYMFLASLMGMLIGPVLSTKLMDASSPWLPLLLALALTPAGSALVFFVPETLKLPSLSSLGHGNGNASTLSPDGESFPPQTKSTKLSANLKSHLTEALHTTLSSLTMLRRPQIALLLLPSLMHHSISLARSQFLVQYISLRFHWSFGSTGYLLGLQGLTNILLFLLILPYISTLLTSPYYPNFSTKQKDYTILLASIALLVLGLLLQSLPLFPLVLLGIVTTSLSTGLFALARSLVTGFVDKEHTSRLYAVIGITEALGGLGAGPAWAVLLQWGMGRGEIWVGVPWWWLSGFAVVVGVGVGFVRREDEDEDGCVRNENE